MGGAAGAGKGPRRGGREYTIGPMSSAADLSPQDSPINLALLTAAAEDQGLAAYLTPEALAAYRAYAAALLQANESLNLTRLTRPDELALQQVLDSLVCLRGLPADQGPQTPLSLVDVGSGAGLPGLALRIACPAWRLTLVESVAKKAAFLRTVAALPALHMADTVVLAARAEDAARLPEHRAAYDLATARAVAALPVLAEYLLPFLRVGGRALALKGAEAAEEARSAAGAIRKLGGELVELLPYRLPGLDQARHLVVIEKRHPTAPAYPRRAGLPTARPLG